MLQADAAGKPCERISEQIIGFSQIVVPLLGRELRILLASAPEANQRPERILPFDNLNSLASVHVLERLMEATRPINLQEVYFRVLHQTDMNNSGIQGTKSVPSIYPIEDAAALHRRRNFGTDRVAIRACADQPHLQAVIATAKITVEPACLTRPPIKSTE